MLSESDRKEIIRNMSFEWKKAPHMSFCDLLKKVIPMELEMLHPDYIDHDVFNRAVLKNLRRGCCKSEIPR